MLIEWYGVTCLLCGMGSHAYHYYEREEGGETMTARLLSQPRSSSNANVAKGFATSRRKASLPSRNDFTPLCWF